MSDSGYRLDQLDDLRALLEQADRIPIALKGTLFCPKCGDFRQMDVQHLWDVKGAKESKATWDRIKAARGPQAPRFPPGKKKPNRADVPALFSYTCRQCSMTFTTVTYRGPDGDDLVVLPSQSGGLKTPHTPEGVAFYLDQAQRAEAAGARSAAVAMFRGALEHLLFEQGYEAGMLSRKLAALEEDIVGGKAPKWAASNLETEFLTLLKDLGNGAIHPNDGNVGKQATLDQDLLAQIKEVFLYLLFLVYETDKKKDRALDALRARASVLKK